MPIPFKTKKKSSNWEKKLKDKTTLKEKGNYGEDFFIFQIKFRFRLWFSFTVDF